MRCMNTIDRRDIFHKLDNFEQPYKYLLEIYFNVLYYNTKIYSLSGLCKYYTFKTQSFV